MGNDVILRQGVAGYVDSYVDPYKTDPTPPPPYTGWKNKDVTLSPTVPLIRLTVYQPTPPAPPAQILTTVVLSPTVPSISISINPNVVQVPSALMKTNIILRVPDGSPTDVYLRAEDFKSYILYIKDAVQTVDFSSRVNTPGAGTAWTKDLSDAVSLSDFFSSVLTSGTAWTKDLADAVSLADSIISKAIGKRITGDAVSLVDSIIARAIGKSITGDSVSLVDAISSRSIGKNITGDAVCLSEGITNKNIQIYKNTDAVSLVDALVKNIALLKTDTISLVENFSSAIFRELILSDAVTLSDVSIQILTSGPLVIVITEPLPVSLANFRGFGADPKRPETPFDIRNLSGFRERI